MATIEKPAPIITMPIARIQRRSRPVDGSVDFVGSVVVVGVVLVVVVFAGVVAAFDGLTSFAGEVPLFGSGAFDVVVVVVVVVVVGVLGVWE